MGDVEVRFWGVRGSVATPGPHTARYGGNTSCVEIRLGDRVIVLDAGTGLARLGKQLAERSGLEVDLLLSHLHWDHIQGFPFFDPVYKGDTLVRIHGHSRFAASFEDAFARQIDDVHHPVRFSSLPSKIEFHALDPARGADLDGRVQVRTASLDHPGGVVAYRLDYGGRSVVYATDHEHFSFCDPALVELARGADLLIYDSQYTEDEYYGRVGHHKVGWGHSTWQMGVRTAREAGVGQLVLFHHDPDHDDAFMDALQREARAEFPATTAAWEGLTVRLET